MKQSAAIKERNVVPRRIPTHQDVCLAEVSNGLFDDIVILRNVFLEVSEVSYLDDMDFFLA